MAIKKSTNTIEYTVTEKCGVVSTNEDTGWSLEVRRVSWNGREPKYDIRTWKEEDGKEICGKGITLTGEELEALSKLLDEMRDN